MRAALFGLVAICGLALGCGPKPTQLPEVRQTPIKITVPKTSEGGKVILHLEEGDYPFPEINVRPCSESGPAHIKLQLAREDSITAFNLCFCEARL